MCLITVAQCGVSNQADKHPFGKYSTLAQYLYMQMLCSLEIISLVLTYSYVLRFLECRSHELSGELRRINQNGYSVTGVFADDDTVVTADTESTVRLCIQGMSHAN